jgi:hypothetical protein
MKKQLIIFLSIILIIITFTLKDNFIFDKKAIVASTLSQYISQTENTKCEYSGFSNDEKENIYKINCENGVKVVMIK